MVMVLMDFSGDQTMSSSSPPQTQPQPPISLAEQIPRPDTGSSSSPSPFQTQTSTETDEHDDEQSKASNQTVVTMHQVSHQQLGSIQAQQKRSELRPSSSSIGGHGELKQHQQHQQQQQQRMIVSGGSSFGDEDDESRLVMNIDSEEEVSSRVVGTNLKLDQAELEARLKQTRFGYQHGGKQTDVESSLVAQMRDIVEGKNQRNIAPILAKATDACQEEDKENIATMAPGVSLEARGQQPKSSNDSLSNNQNNDNDQSRVPVDNAGQKRSRHVSRHQCRHHHHDHNPHHHHHHHHHHHRHHQSISGGSLPGQMGAGTSSEIATSKPSSQTHHGHSHHHHRHNHGHHHHHHHHLVRQRHSNAGHHHQHSAGHNHHGHHHHHNHNQNQQEGEPSKRGSPVHRPSLALIEPGSVGAGNGTRIEATDGCTNDSSMSSMSSLANRQLRTVQTATTSTTTNNPNQSKSSESAVSGEQSTSVAAATNDGDQIVHSREVSAVGAGHSRGHHHHHHHHGNSHHHHYHHQHCQHRSNKRRLVVDTRDSGEKQGDETQGDVSVSANDTRREPLRDATIEQTTDIKSDQASQHLGHHHHHHHHRNHCHCAHRHGVQAENQQAGDGDQTSAQSKTHLHHHHNYCNHRHHRYHHHHHHHHQPGRQQQSRSRQRSISQTNITTKDGGEQPEGTDPVDEMATERRNSVRAEVDEVVKMETSPPPQLAGSTSSEAQQTNEEPASSSVVGDLAIKSVAGTVDSTEANRNEATQDGTLNEGSNFMDSKNQESLRSGSDEANDQQQQRIDGVNKLTRQMSSQSSRRSQNTGGALPPAESPGRRQSEHLRECAERALQPAAGTTAINQRESESARQAVEPTNGLLADRRCRLCWCCCCPCSALSTRDASSRPTDKPKAVGVLAASNSPVSSNYPSLPNVPLDEIRSWGESFDKLMRCSDGRKVFQDFLRCEYSEENILFWSACEELKKERDSKSVAAKARDIYEDYISILSSKEVSLDSRVRDVINHNIKRPTSNIFDEAQLQIYTLMHRDSYPRFINSIMYKKLAQIPISNSRKSSS